MKLKKLPDNILKIITFLLFMFLGMINEIKNIKGLIIYGVLILILVINITIIFKYGRDAKKWKD